MAAAGFAVLRHIKKKSLTPPHLRRIPLISAGARCWPQAPGIRGIGVELWVNRFFCVSDTGTIVRRRIEGSTDR